jgi:hypothetical protein
MGLSVHYGLRDAIMKNQVACHFSQMNFEAISLCLITLFSAISRSLAMVPPDFLIMKILTAHM